MSFKGLFIKEEEQQNQEKPKEVAPTVASVIPDKWVFDTPKFNDYTNELTKVLEEVCV